MRRLPRTGRWLPLALAALAAALVYWSPALVFWEATGFGDWQQFQHQWEAAYVSVVRYGELPLWNPWHCGGVILFGDPQAQAYSPLFWLLLPFGTAAGLKIFLVLHTAFGWAGMVLFARRHLGVGPAASWAAALLWAGSGFFAWHGSGGHSAFLPFYFAPWLLLAWRKAATDLRYAAAVAGIMALVLLEGGVYPFPYFCLLLAFDGVVQIARAPDRAGRLAVFRAGAVALPLMLLLGGFRLVPVLNTMSRYPRPTAGDDALSIPEVIAMLTSKEYDYGFPGHEYVWAEYGTFIGWIALALGLVGVVLAARRQRWVLAGFLVFGGLMLGRVTPFHPWALLHALPVYGSLRVPSRFAVLMTFYLGLGAAIALQAAVGWLARRRWRHDLDFLRGALPWVLLLAIAGHLAWGNGAVIDRWRGPPLPPVDHDAEYHLISRHQYGAYASFPARGVSNVGCYTGMTYPAAPGLWEGQRAQVRLRPGGEVHGVERTANTITADVELSVPGDLVINQTWARGWSSDVGRVEQGDRGLIVVRGVPLGRRRVRLRYVPDDLALASALGGTGLLATLFVAWWPSPARLRRRRRRARPPAAATSAPG